MSFDYLSFLTKISKDHDPKIRVGITIHSALVTRKALELARMYQEKNPDVSIDFRFLEEMAMLHDIGIFKTDKAALNLVGEQPYVRHGLIGAKILEDAGLKRHARGALTHQGISNDIIAENEWPLPRASYEPRTIEEEVLCLADYYYSKYFDTLFYELSSDEVREKAKQFGDAYVAVFDRLLEKYGETPRYALPKSTYGVDYLSLLAKYCEDEHPETIQVLLIHSTLVTWKAMQYALRYQKDHPSFEIDFRLLEEICMLHDIGLFSVDDPPLKVTGGGGHYVRHIEHGETILNNEGLPKHAKAARSHMAMTKEAVEDSGFPLPAEDKLPETVQEEILMLGDAHFTKHQQKLFQEKSIKESYESGLRFHQCISDYFKYLLEKYFPEELQKL